MAKAVLGLLVLGGALFFIFSGDKKANNDNNLKEDTENVSGESDQVEKTESLDFEEKTTLTKLMSKGGNYECNFSHVTDISESTGTVFISGKKIRGDFVSKVTMSGVPDMGDIKTFMISDGESVYTWSSMSSDGYKVPQSKQEVSGQTSTNIPSNQELDYKCVGWKVDESKFSLPSNITFKTL